MSAGSFHIDVEAVRELARLLDETGLSEIELEDGGRKLRVVRGGGAPAAPSAPAPTASETAPPEEAPERASPGAVTSPMVGIAYLAPEPGAAPYVKVGDIVAQDDTLLIVEAMKVMNPIRAPHAGTVKQILVENGRPVEYGQILMVVD